MGTSEKHVTPRTIVAASSGNVLEWYDFTSYSFLAPILGQVFFPSDNTVSSLLSAFAVLAVGYLARPLGSVIFGHVGDRFGRKPAMMVSVILMGLGSFMIAVLPTPAQIGLSATVLLVLIRVMQGISVAGDGAGIGGAHAAEHQGRLAALHAARRLGAISTDECDSRAVTERQSLAHELAARPFLTDRKSVV